MTETFRGRRATLLALIILLFSLLAPPRNARAEAPDIVVSIKPVHSLVAAVMSGAGTPHLLVRGAASPHTYSLRPSDARALEAADMIFYVGPTLETLLVRPIARRRGTVRAVALIEAPGITRYPLRAGGLWDEGNESGGHHRDHSGEWDPHIWLDPSNAAAIVRHAADLLAGRDPENAARYVENREDTLRRLGALDAEIEAQFASVRDYAFISLHDAFQYLERRYRLRAAGTITLSPARRPGPRRLASVQRYIAENDVRCVFVEPQIPDTTARVVVEGTDARIAVLDPLGFDLPAGPDAYFEMMREIAANLVECLRDSE